MSFKTYVLAASASRIATGDSGVVKVPLGGQGVDASFVIDCTVASVADTLDLDLVAVIEGVTVTLVSFTQITAAPAQEIKTIVNCPDSIQANWTIGGTTPDFTFSISAWRH